MLDTSQKVIRTPITAPKWSKFAETTFQRQNPVEFGRIPIKSGWILFKLGRIPGKLGWIPSKKIKWIMDFGLKIKWIVDFGQKIKWIMDFGLKIKWIMDFGLKN